MPFFTMSTYSLPWALKPKPFPGSSCPFQDHLADDNEPSTPALTAIWGAVRYVERRAKRADGQMTEILFYHLKEQAPEQVLPALLLKSLERGWRVVVQASSEERIEALDAHLWTWRDDSFLPHGTWRDAEAAQQPIMLAVNDDNPNGAAVRFLIEGAAMPSDAAAYQRVVVLFDGEDPDAVETARARWREAKSAGFDVTYWQADENGGWRRQG
jgi:DNA polymerase-3 subunit chi